MLHLVEQKRVQVPVSCNSLNPCYSTISRSSFFFILKITEVIILTSL